MKESIFERCGKCGSLFLYDQIHKCKPRPTGATKKEFTVKAWKKFKPEAQEALLGKYDVIFTDHKTRNEKLFGILKAILRPTPTQRIQQRKKLNHTIEKVQSGITKFDDAMDQFSKGLNSSVSKGNRDDPVELVFGKRNAKPHKTKKKTKTPDPVERIMGKPNKDKYKALLG